MTKKLKGINRDSEPIDQPEGTYRDALNVLLTKKLGAVVSEEGTEVAIDLTNPDYNLGGYEILGDTLIYDGVHVLFLTDGDNSEIGTFDGDNYTQVLNNTDLNFQEGSTIEAVTLLNDKGEAIVYWTDDINPPRYYNIDTKPTVNTISTINLFPTIEVGAKIDLDRVAPTGGTLQSGAYYFVIALFAEDGSRTNYMSPTPPVYINDDGDPSSYDSYDGVSAGTQTSKAIHLNLTNLDQNYEEFQIVAIRKEGDTIADVEKLSKRSITSSSISLNYTGSENTTPGSFDEVLTNTTSYTTAKSIIEQDDTLYLGNLTKKPDIGYQKYANNIKVESQTKFLKNGSDTIQQGAHYGDSSIAFYDKSFKRGEVYAFYISFVLSNGQESKAYHIPGRAIDGDSEKETNTYDTEKYKLEAEYGTNNMGFWENEGEHYPDTEDFDVWDVDSNGNGYQTTGTLREDSNENPINVRHHHFPETKDAPFYDDDGYFQTLGVNLKDVKIPKDIIDDVKGVKLYYAKRTDNNKRVIGQGLVSPLVRRGAPDSYKGNDIPDDFFLQYSIADQADFNYGLSFYSFNLIREKTNIGSITHLKKIGQNEGPEEDHTTYSDLNNFHLFVDQKDDVIVSNSIEIAKPSAITYVEEDDYVGNAVSNGFSYNIFNYDGPEYIAIECDDADLITGFYDSSNNRVRTKLIDLIQLQQNLYFPFDQQELVWTGYMETDVSRFDPRENGEDGKAQGSIEVTSGAEQPEDGSPAEVMVTVNSNNLQYQEGSKGTASLSLDEDNRGADYASATITVVSTPTGISSGEDFYYNFDFYGELGVTSATLTKGNVIIADCVTALVDAFNNNSVISADWTASIVDGSSDTLIIEADNVGTQYNNEDISNFYVTEDTTGNNVNNDCTETFPTSGGSDLDPSVPGVTVEIGSLVSDSFTIDNTDSLSEIAIQIRDVINNSSSLNSDFSATVNGTVINLETVNETGSFNGDLFTLSMDSGSSGIVYTDSSVSGGQTFINESENCEIRADSQIIGTIIAEGNDSLEDIASKISSNVVEDPWTAYDILGEPYMMVEANRNGSDLNGIAIGLEAVDVDTTTDTTSGGVDNSEIDDLLLTLLPFPYGIEYSINVLDGSTKEEVAQFINYTINNFVSDYSSTVTGSTVNIVADDPGTIYNTEIDLDVGNTSVGSNLTHLTGGKDIEPHTEIISYGGDTFLNLCGFSFRRGGVVEDTPEWEKIISTLFYAPCETPDNIKLRHTGEDPIDIYYPKSTAEQVATAGISEDKPYNNPIEYNPDYSALAEIKSAIPAEKDGEAITNFPTRVIRSAEGNQSTDQEGIRTFLENDHIDLTRSKGPLVTLSIMNNALFPHMERALIRTKGREELSTGDFRAYLGAGDIFAAKPDELISTREGFGGTQDPRTTLSTPYGYFFVDRQAKEVILISDKPNVISEKGMKNFFYDELSDIGDDKLIATWDNKWDRIILTYKGKWTISYYPKLKAWGSFHSYTPEYYLSDLDTFYGLKGDAIHKHNVEGNPCNFYGSQHNYEFEFIDNRSPRKTKIFTNIQLITEVKDPSGNTYQKETFDQFRIFNNLHDSGLKDIIYFTDPNGNARNVEGTWKINQFRDMLVNGVVDQSKSWYEQGKIRGKYVSVKLIYGNSGNKSLYLYNSELGVKESIR